MQTSRNPKVLNNALKYKLQPMLDKIGNLESLSENYDVAVEDKKRLELELKNQANQRINTYNDYNNTLMDKIDEANVNLSNLINNNLYNPNKTSEGYEDDPNEYTEESKLITDKIVKCAAYGFVKDGVDYCLFGVTGKGLAIGTYPGQNLEYEWRNPGNDDSPFASYYINDILYLDTHTAMISTNNGIVVYDFNTDSYIVYDNTHGLPSKNVYSVVKVSNNDETAWGFIAATNNGIAYSPTGEHWTRIDENFSSQITCLASINLINTPHKIVFIGTTKGIYYIDASELIDNDIRSVKYLVGSSNILPSTYVYGLAYNTETNTLAVATIGGATIINDITDIIINNETVTTDDVITLTNRNGLGGTSCYDVAYTVDNKLILGTANGLNITSDYQSFNSITKINNNYTANGKVLNSNVCNKIVRISAHNYSILHSIGITEDLTI